MICVGIWIVKIYHKLYSPNELCTRKVIRLSSNKIYNPVLFLVHDLGAVQLI